MERLKPIEALVARLFSERWTVLHADDALGRADLRFPGVYLLAHSEADFEGARVDARDVLYVGMSNADGGVRKRLKQFCTGIEKNRAHSGARRFYREYCGSLPLSQAGTGKRFYFAALTLPCASEKAKAGPDDLIAMGHVACLEYYAIAHVAAETGKKPALNKFGAADAPQADLPEGGTQ
jgi:hypothetical protein